MRDYKTCHKFLAFSLASGLNGALIVLTTELFLLSFCVSLTDLKYCVSSFQPILRVTITTISYVTNLDKKNNNEGK
jgi:hypothetical protein